jgi:low affinity Fe/Cu permease
MNDEAMEVTLMALHQSELKNDKKPLKLYTLLAASIEFYVGHPMAFLVAVVFVAGWVAFGSLYFGSEWHTVLHTVTSSITFLMVFLIQHTENRDSVAIQLKLDELLRATKGARNALVNVEDLTMDDLERVRSHYRDLTRSARSREEHGESDTESRDVNIG